MVNFVVVDDNCAITSKVENIINKIMVKNEIDYNIEIFNDYNSEFNKLINSKISSRIYILDIETKSASGIDIARKIRSKDLDSVIIFITAHEELGNLIIKQSLMILNLICKFDNFDKNLKESILKSLKIIGKKKIMRFYDYNSLYTIAIDDILYITKDTVERKSVIVTDYTTYKVSTSLLDLKKLGYGLLVQSHKSCLVNKSRISKINITKKTITFNNGLIIDLFSDNYKEELM